MLNICPNFSAAPLTLQSVVTILSKFDSDSNALPPTVLSKDMRASMQLSLYSFLCFKCSYHKEKKTKKVNDDLQHYKDVCRP